MAKPHLQENQMKQRINISWVLCLSLLLNVNLALSHAQVKIIYETDMESDIDDLVGRWGRHSHSYQVESEEDQ